MFTKSYQDTFASLGIHLTVEDACTGTVWYLEAKDEGHGFAKKNNVDFLRYATINFMNKYLLDPDPKQPTKGF